MHEGRELAGSKPMIVDGARHISGNLPRPVYDILESVWVHYAVSARCMARILRAPVGIIAPKNLLRADVHDVEEGLDRPVDVECYGGRVGEASLEENCMKVTGSLEKRIDQWLSIAKLRYAIYLHRSPCDRSHWKVGPRGTTGTMGCMIIARSTSYLPGDSSRLFKLDE